MLSQLPDEVTERSERIGRNLAVALQAFIELQPFIEENHFDSDLSLGSAPVLFHLQNDSKLLEYIGTCEGDIDNLDLKKVTFSLPPEPQGTIQVLRRHVFGFFRPTHLRQYKQYCKSAKITIF